MMLHGMFLKFFVCPVQYKAFPVLGPVPCSNLPKWSNRGNCDPQYSGRNPELLSTFTDGVMWVRIQLEIQKAVQSFPCLQ